MNKSKIPKDQYFSLEKMPEEWFMPLSEFSQSEYVKEYMDPEARSKTLKVMLEHMVAEKVKERKKK
tara:strand:+ start:6703 stop:6900 length:198 start_codon:yes stop_codon:yes gene_type:complete